MRTPELRRTARRTVTAGAAAPLLLLAACGAGGSTDADPASPEEPTATAAAPSEVGAAAPRLAITHDGGITVLDATSMEVVGEIEMAGFNRLNPAGDGRHLMVSTQGGFEVLDMGAWGEPHGDHSHYYTSDPAMSGTVFGAEKPGHVVVHHGRTVLFDDGTGDITVLDAAQVASEDADVRELSAPEAHHGVAVELADGSLLVSEGTEDARTGARVLDADGQEIASSQECPGVHGEAMAADETVAIGCEDGILLYAGGQFTKVASPDPYGRIGNQAGDEGSPIVLGDYKSDPDAELERPTRVSLVDTRTAELTLVDLPASYTFRSLGRGDDGEALVLGTDGALHVIDPESGELTDSFPVIDAWQEPEDWQQARPALHVLDGTAYVTDPANDAIHAVDIETGEVWNTAELEVTPNEVASVSGDAPTGHDHGHDHEHDHG